MSSPSSRLRVTRIGVVALLAATLALAGCASPTPAPPTSPADAAAPAPGAVPSRLVDPTTFAAAVAEPRRVTIDVHVPFAGRVPGTDAAIPFDRITASSPGLPADRTTPLAIYCRTGPMSQTAAAELSRLGFQDIVELSGGMAAWREAGRPLEDAPVGAWSP